MSAYPEHVDDHERDADGNRRIGDVEGPEMPGPPVDVDEIDHRTLRDAIDQVAGRSADDERQPDAREHLLMAEAERIEPDADERCGRDDRQRDGLEWKVHQIQEPESRPAIPHV